MAAVIKARDLELDRLVALKILPPEASQDAESIARFKQEARAVALLDHENIARVYYCGEDQGLHFIAFEFVEGENLRTLIERRGPLPASECVHYLLQIAAGLHHAWERGVVHRDIKPSNIIITPDGRAKIVDMGLARFYDAPTDGGMTQSGVTLGTFDYISPEQALDPRRTDVRSDIYSLGCTFYHALTGRPPVEEGTAAKKLYAHQHLEPIDPRLLNPAIPDELAIILARMMAKDPSRRYQTPLELIADLKGLAERLCVSVDTSDTAVQATPGTAELLPRHWLNQAIGLVSLVVVALLLITLVGPFIAPVPPPGPPSWAQPDPVVAAAPPPPQALGTNLATNADAQKAEVRTVEELVTALRRPQIRQIFLAAGDYDLSHWHEAIVTRTTQLELIGSDVAQVRIRLRSHPTANSKEPPGAGSWTLKAERFVARHLQWEILETDLTDDDPELVFPAGLLLQDTTNIQLQDCIFRSNAAAERWCAAMAVVTAYPSPQLLLERCVFAASSPRAGIGVLLPAGSHVQAEDCGFGPHRSLIRLLPPEAADLAEPQQLLPTSVVHLSRCSFLLERRCCVVNTIGPCRVRAGYCVFAASTAPVRSEQMGAIIATAKAASIHYEGERRNAYFAVQPVATIEAGMMTQLWSFDECRSQGWSVSDAHAVRLTRPPWSDNRPFERLQANEPWPAFRLRIDQEAALFVRDRIKVIGAQFRDEVQGLRAYPQLVTFPRPPTDSPSAATTTPPRPLVWQPHPPPDAALPPGTSSDLATLIRQARPDDTILIRHDGLLLLDHTEILDLRSRSNGGSECKITFKPYPKTKPILTIDPANRSLDQYLFQLRSGEVEFVELHFLIKPSLPQNNMQSAAALSLLHGRGCTFDRCTFTLIEDGDARAAVVHLSDPDKIMALDGMPRPTPTLRFQNCFVRGKGRGVWITGGRTLLCEWNNSLLALHGSVAVTEASHRAAGETQWRWNHCTFWLAGPLLELQGQANEEMRPIALPRQNVETDACLWIAAPAANRPLVELHFVDPDIKNYLSWQTRQGNRYANFDPQTPPLVLRPAVDAAMLRQWNWDQWLSFAGEPPAPHKPLGTVTFVANAQKLHDPTRLAPSDLRLQNVQFPDLDAPDPDLLPAGLLDPTALPPDPAMIEIPSAPNNPESSSPQ
jgi:predicted Ser/Thr protein kinase